MPSAGGHHSVMLRSDGQLVAFGANSCRQCDLPQVEEGVSYTQIAAGEMHTVLLRSDGRVVACGCNNTGQCEVPETKDGVTYTQVAAGADHTVLLRSDGRVVACGGNHYKQIAIAVGLHELRPANVSRQGLVYTQIAAGGCHTVLLRSDGRAVAFGRNRFGECNLPETEEGVSYRQVAAGGLHTVLLRSDGRVVACGDNSDGQCDLPKAEEGVSYTQVAAGAYHTVLLRTDGRVVACGHNSYGQCDLVQPRDGVRYTHVAAGGCVYWNDVARHGHTLLLRSDGRAVACGSNTHGQCNLPEADLGVTYIPNSVAEADRVVQLLVEGPPAGRTATCRDLGGVAIATWTVVAEELEASVSERVRATAAHPGGRLHVLLPDGSWLAQTPALTWAEFFLT